MNPARRVNCGRTIGCANIRTVQNNAIKILFDFIVIRKNKPDAVNIRELSIIMEYAGIGSFKN
jgi:hypothetical protein